MRARLTFLVFVFVFVLVFVLALVLVLLDEDKDEDKDEDEDEDKEKDKIRELVARVMEWSCPVFTTASTCQNCLSCSKQFKKNRED